MMNCSLKMLDTVLKMMDLAMKMMNLGIGAIDDKGLKDLLAEKLSE